MMKDDDFCIVTFGYNQYVVPYKVGLTLFQSFKGMEIYRYDTKWDSKDNKSRPIIKDIDETEYPTIKHLSPSVMLWGRENWRKLVEDEQRKEKEKE